MYCSESNLSGLFERTSPVANEPKRRNKNAQSHEHAGDPWQHGCGDVQPKKKQRTGYGNDAFRNEHPPLYLQRQFLVTLYHRAFATLLLLPADQLIFVELAEAEHDYCFAPVEPAKLLIVSRRFVPALLNCPLSKPTIGE